MVEQRNPKKKHSRAARCIDTLAQGDAGDVDSMDDESHRVTDPIDEHWYLG